MYPSNGENGEKVQSGENSGAGRRRGIFVGAREKDASARREGKKGARRAKEGRVGENVRGKKTRIMEEEGERKETAAAGK